MRRQLTHGLALALCLTLVACDPEPTVDEAPFEATPEGLALLDSVRGGWQLSGSIQDDCPEEASVPFPLGPSSWTEADGRLVVEGLGGQALLLLLPALRVFTSLTLHPLLELLPPLAPRHAVACLVP